MSMPIRWKTSGKMALTPEIRPFHSHFPCTIRNTGIMREQEAVNPFGRAAITVVFPHSTKKGRPKWNGLLIDLANKLP
ncbi:MULTISPECIES: hypothetical protein [Pirellulaceae]|uniref:hypothetical protein n=1 Tax=Pirellulaceae TaxID=2691357 RepID=UPI000CF918BF|nr:MULTISPECIES: hypothetical protein [Pirellulaceae]